MAPKQPPPTLQRFMPCPVKQPPPTLQRLLMMPPLENVCPVPKAAPLSALAACTDVGGVQTQPRASANSSSHLSPPSDDDSPWHFVEEFNEAAAARVIMLLKITMEHLLPDRAEDYWFRGTAYSLMADIDLLIKRGQMDNETWTYHHLTALCVVEQMFESEGFPRDACNAKLAELGLEDA